MASGRNGSMYSRCCGYNWPVIKAIVFDAIRIVHRDASPLMIYMNFTLLLRIK